MQFRNYCDMITWSVARQGLGKHVSATTHVHARIKYIVGNGVMYEVSAETIEREPAASKDGVGAMS
jgi:hypothetical protein